MTPLLRVVLAVSLLATLDASPCLCAESASTLKPYPLPAWVSQTTRPFFADPKYTVEEAREFKSYGVQAIFNCFGGEHHIFYNGKKFYFLTEDTKKPIGDVDFAELRANIGKYKAVGIKTIGAIWPMWEREVLEANPDWQLLRTPSDRPRTLADTSILHGCWYSPFGDFYIDKNRRIMEELDCDAQNIDGFGTSTFCYCPHCRKGFREATGLEIPTRQTAAPAAAGSPETLTDIDATFSRYARWRFEEWGKFVHKWTGVLKAKNPDFAFIPWSAGPGRWWHWSALPSFEGSEFATLMVDAPVLELFWDFPPDQGMNLLPSFTSRLYRGFTEERAAWMHVYCRSQGQQPAVTPRVESAFRVLSTLANGAVPILGVWHVDNDTTPKYYFDLVKEREKWVVGAKTYRWAAMLSSENSRMFYGIPGSRSEFGGTFKSGVDTDDFSQSPAGERRLPAHIESCLGVYRTALEAHLPLDFVSDRMVEQGRPLETYKVLVLPDAACLSESAAESIRAFVKRGGGLVVTQTSSLLDERGAKRKNFALADVFGVDYEKTVDHTARWPNFSNTCYVRFEDHKITNDPIIRRTFQRWHDGVDFIGWTTQVKPRASAQVIARYVPSRSINQYNPERSRDDEKGYPFLVLSKYGKGRVAYFAAAIDQSYFVTPYQYERPLIANAIRWAAGDNPPLVEVEAPMCVQATHYTQNEGKRLVVHLVNEINTTANRALPESNPSLREEVIPLAGIRVTLRDPAFRSVHLEPGHLELPIQRTERGLEVTVPELRLHSMVVAER
jgi:uncharacterized membrane protein